MTTMTLYVLVQPTDPDLDLGEDEGLGGVYEVSGRWAGVGEACDAACVKDALDTFHDQWGIDNLDNFVISVVNSQGREIIEPETFIPGQLAPLDIGGLTAEHVAENIPAFLRKLRREASPKRPRATR